MTDGNYITELVEIASNPMRLDAAQAEAGQELLHFDGEKYPADGCAITLSTLLRESGIDIPFTFQALALDNALQKRGWQRIAIGEQKAGDVGSTCVSYPRHGSDHIFLVLHALNTDEMLIADNQSRSPHFRYASGKGGKTPTTHFLRAPAAS